MTYQGAYEELGATIATSTGMMTVPDGVVLLPLFGGDLTTAQLQVQMNRLMPSYSPALPGLPLIVDGKFGTNTYNAIRRIAAVEEGANSRLGDSISKLLTSMMSASSNRATLLQMLTAIGDSDGLAGAILWPFVPPAGTKPKPVVAGTNAAPPPDTIGLGGGMSSTTKIVIAAVGIGVALALMGKKKRGRR